ncbi:MAG: hypothetical protein E3J54_03520 [Actinobacteria bacterium]|nr:MAG: hypothetical protein E3J54_03520 [Actinomycetota bacterium]
MRLKMAAISAALLIVFVLPSASIKVSEPKFEVYISVKGKKIPLHAVTKTANPEIKQKLVKIKKDS